MTKKAPPTLGDTWRKLLAQREKGKPEPTQLPTRLPFWEVKLWPEVFQHRQPLEHVSEMHVRELQRAVSAGDLEPITVWWDGKQWACLDGHHRFKAYNLSDKGLFDLPVQVFSGSPEQAIAEAATRNTRDKLPMSRSEKVGSAWRLVVTTSMSKADTVRASGASDGIVGQMRRVKAQLSAQGMAVDGMDWEEARRRAAGTLDLDVDWDNRTEQEAQEMANKIVKALGQRASNRLDAFARALEIYDARLPDLLREHWDSEQDDDEEVLSEDD